MLGLLQAYGSDESESDSEIEEAIPEKDGNKLPNPFEAQKSESVLGGPLEKSVFVNPYVAADDAKNALLEKHVKMTSKTTDTKMINGKRVCWNHLRNKCRFGHNCKYAHDSDLLSKLRNESETQNSQVTEGNEEVSDSGLPSRGKKRPGLSASLIPSKKVMKIYHQQKKNK